MFGDLAPPISRSPTKKQEVQGGFLPLVKPSKKTAVAKQHPFRHAQFSITASHVVLSKRNSGTPMFTVVWPLPTPSHATSNSKTHHRWKHSKIDGYHPQFENVSFQDKGHSQMITVHTTKTSKTLWSWTSFQPSLRSVKNLREGQNLDHLQTLRHTRIDRYPYTCVYIYLYLHTSICFSVSIWSKKWVFGS